LAANAKGGALTTKPDIEFECFGGCNSDTSSKMPHHMDCALSQPGGDPGIPAAGKDTL